MRLSSGSVSSSLKQRGNRSGSKLKKKHKRLDAICEKEYSRNHGDVNEDGSGLGNATPDSGVRRSSRVRRAPELLDASPSPRKKRRRIHGNGALGVKKSAETVQLSGDLNDETRDSWRSRLRSRNRKLGVGAEKGSCISRKRKLFEEIVEVKVENNDVRTNLDERKGNLKGGESIVGKSNRSGRIRAKDEPSRIEREVKSSQIKDDYGREHMFVISSESEEGEEEEVGEELEDKEAEILEHEGKDNALLLQSETDDENAAKIMNNYIPQSNEEVEKEIPSILPVDEAGVNDHDEEPTDKAENTNNSEIQVEKLTCANEGVNKIQNVEAGGVSTNEVADKKHCNKKDVCLGIFAEKSIKHDVDFNLKNFTNSSTGTSRKSHIKEGRRCGLCGGGTDGKPSKKLVQDLGESENEVCSGSSASEEPNYDMWDGFGDEPGWLGRLLGPINDRYGIAGIWVHQHCAVWSPEVYFAGLGCLKNVRAALCRGRALKCTRCGRPGATIGCRVDRCPKTYHLPCARANGCIFDHRKFLIACTDHRHIFQPHGNQYLARIKRLKARKMKLEVKKLSNDAWRRDIEAEEKWLENCGEDEEFLKRESKRLHRDLLRIAPVYIGGSDSESEKLFQGWESVAGLQGVIQCLKEVVFLPLLYPEFFDHLGITPPRGVLLHGYPGTGKTHVVRALIGSCARGDKRIAYFARKGADCLGKYVGDAERQLRLLFQVAERCQPSIIFFDEIDGLAPCRTRQQDQTHNSVVSTLLALLDGLKSRGSVVVIGATNRPDAVDPALRRPGRFDREIYFPLPSVEDRAAILSLHTQKWPKTVDGPLLQWIARKTAGFAGADLQALCTQAAISALKRNFPLKEVLSASGKQASGDNRPALPAIAVEERDWLEALLYSPPPCSRREAGMAANDVASSPLPSHLIPCLLHPLSTLLVSLFLDERICLPGSLLKAATTIKSVVISALNEKKMVSNCWWSHVNDFVQEADTANEIERKLHGCGVFLGDSTFGCSNVWNDDAGDANAKLKGSVDHHGGPAAVMAEQTSFDLGNKSGFRILIAGNPRSGPRHLASCLLHCYIEHVEIRKVDMATISQEGYGDLVQGISRILLNCSSMGSCIVFMPRIDLWAVEHCYLNERENDYDLDESKSTQIPGLQGGSPCPSRVWSSFVEQVESLSRPLMILATSEVPFSMLPQELRQFFRNDLSISKRSTTLEHTVPRFSVQIDANFNHDMVINQSAAEISRDIVKMVVHMIHRKSHTNASPCMKYQTSAIQDQTNAADHQKVTKISGECIRGTKSTIESSVRVPPLPGSRTMRVKSNLVSAISTFGYQILRYPHFAELCWVTSKLKEGPSADTSGPWKGWPFNSCIIRPLNASEKVASVSFNNGKSKEISGMVRGLIAVGLSAIKGVYTSLRKVSSDIREVLDLLVEQINEKVNAGKDRYQYVRLLSQVAYLEDVVNNWVYTLQSLEQDSQKIRSEENNIVISSKSSLSQEIAEGSCQEPVDVKTVHIDSMEDGDFSHSHSEDKTLLSKGKGERNLCFNNSPSDESYQNANAAGDNHLTDNILMKHYETVIGPNDLENTRNRPVVNGNSVTLAHNLSTESLNLDQNRQNSSKSCAGKFSKYPKCSRISNGSCVETGNSPQIQKHNEGIHSSSSENGLSSSHSATVCSIQCCTGCLNTLHGLTRKIILCEFGSNCKSVEDVHDVVAALSVDLLAAVRRLFADGNDQQREVNKDRFKPSDLSSCRCKSLRNLLAKPVECICHSENGTLSEKENGSPCSQPKFIFQDGVLVNVDPEKNVSFHCKLKTLCLCSVSESIAMAKKPSC